MHTHLSRALGALLVLGLVACGGGGGDSPAPSNGGGNNGGGSSTPVTLGTPSAPLTASNSTATDLTTEAKAAIEAAVGRSQLPTGVNLTGVPGGAAVTINCSAGGSFTYDYPSTIASGTTYSYTYNNCSYGGGYVYNGSYVLRYDSFVSASNFAWTATYDLRLTGPNNFSYHYTSNQTCSYVNGAASCLVRDNGRTFSADFTYANGVINGTYQWTWGTRGTVTYRFINWGATSGRIEVTGSNGTSAVIVRNSANSFTVTITVNGTTTTYTTS